MTQPGCTSTGGDYYTTQVPMPDGSRDVYDIWERGEAYNDSITPSTYVPEYRRHIVDKILSLTRPDDRVVSLGCGNGFVEADVVAAGRSVTAYDRNERAVELTTKKGVDARVLDVFDLQKEDTEGTSLLYADGLFGHLYDPVSGLAATMSTLRRLGLPTGTHLLVSNDAPDDIAARVAPHPSVGGFWFFSTGYLAEEMEAASFDVVTAYYYVYSRPLSGARRRTIGVARVA